MVKYPCNTCIVRPKCSEICNDFHEYLSKRYNCNLHTGDHLKEIGNRDFIERMVEGAQHSTGTAFTISDGSIFLVVTKEE